MKNWTIKRRIIVGFTVITAIAGALGIFSLVQLSLITLHSVRITENSLPGIYRTGQLAERIQFLGNLNSTLVLKNLISSNEDLKSDLEAEVKKNIESIDALAKSYESTLDSAKDRELFADSHASAQAVENATNCHVVV